MKTKQRQLRLMIVDDHAETRGLIRELATHFAGEIVECSNGEEAVDRCAEFVPDVVTMDLRMHAMDGLEATRKIVRLHPEARIVIITQSGSPAHREAAINAGASYFMAKDELVQLPQYLRYLTA